jgi:hypothetical protein
LNARALAMVVLAALALAAAALTGCVADQGFVCHADAQCIAGGVHGRCEANGFCSFPDANCDSGWRFAESAGASSGSCVMAASFAVRRDLGSDDAAPITDDAAPTGDDAAPNSDDAAPNSDDAAPNSDDAAPAPVADLAVNHDLAKTPPDLAPPPPDLASPCGVCNAPSICCGNQCVNPATDANNCGACGNSCASGLCGQAVSATLSTAPSTFAYNGFAYEDPTTQTGVLTDSALRESGSIVYSNAIVTDTVDISFEFKMSPGGGADGIGFMLETDGSFVLGDTGAGLGMAGLDGFGVELDAFDNMNAASCGETSGGQHINIDTLGRCQIGDGTFAPTPLTTPVRFTVSDGNWHQALIHISASKISVSIKTGATTTTVFSNVPLPSTVFTSGRAYFYGITGATGGISERHEIRNVAFKFPTPRCL